MGGQISAAGESLQQAALTYQAGGSTLAEFETAFRHFETNVQPPIEQINALTPPPAATGVHQKLTAGLGQCNQAINFMNEWFKTQQEDAKQMTSVLVFSCVSQVKAAEEELKGLVAK